MGVTNTSGNTHLCLHHSSSKKPIVPADTQRPQWSMKSRCWDPAMGVSVGLVNVVCSRHFIETGPAVWFRMKPQGYFLWICDGLKIKQLEAEIPVQFSESKELVAIESRVLDKFIVYSYFWFIIPTFKLHVGRKALDAASGFSMIFIFDVWQDNVGAEPETFPGRAWNISGGHASRFHQTFSLKVLNLASIKLRPMPTNTLQNHWGIWGGTSPKLQKNAARRNRTSLCEELVTGYVGRTWKYIR